MGGKHTGHRVPYRVLMVPYRVLMLRELDEVARFPRPGASSATRARCRRSHNQATGYGTARAMAFSAGH
jgi:hypothetical protein